MIGEHLKDLTEHRLQKSKDALRAAQYMHEQGTLTFAMNRIIRKTPNIDWDKIARFRDLVSHHYDQIDHEIVYDICQRHIPKLKQNDVEDSFGNSVTFPMFNVLNSSSLSRPPCLPRETIVV